MMRRTPASLLALPVLFALAGGAAGWFMRDTAAPTGPVSTVVGAALPTGAALDSIAPPRHAPTLPNTIWSDRNTLVGLPSTDRVPVPKGAALPLVRGEGGALVPVDVNSLQPAQVGGEPLRPAVEPTPIDAAATPAAPPNTAAVGGVATTLAPPTAGSFVDPCVATTDPPCVGTSGRVVAPVDGPAAAPDPLTLSVPMAAAGDLATMCDTIEAGVLPDPFLGPQVRPTVAVVVNQPASIALTGTWADGTPLDKLTMRTSAAFEQQWQTQWDTTGVQGSLVQCLTLPLDDVRAHAAAGRAVLDARLLAISKDGRTELGGRLTLTVPLDGNDEPFVDAFNVTSMGELRRADGTLAPTVHVHYAITDDQLLPTSGPLQVATAKLYAEHAFVASADCAGWANNRTGADRTLDGVFSVANEQRTVNGRTRPVTIVDGDVALDPTLPGGWEGFLCARVFYADAAGHTETVVLRGTAVRSPLSATYDVGVVVDDPTFPAGWTLEATWSTPGTAPWCGPVVLSADDTGASCVTSARFVADGVQLMLRPVNPDGVKQPAFIVTVPVNAAYCTPDDPFAAIGNGCDTGFVQLVRLPLDGTQSVMAHLQAIRSAAPAITDVAPAHLWRIDVPQAFPF